MSERFPLERLLAALPNLPDLESVREALLARSEPDPAHAWSSAGRYVTYDKRVVSADAALAALADARAAAHARVDRTHDVVTALLEAQLANDPGRTATRLLELGAVAEREGAIAPASACVQLAASIAAEQHDAAALAAALRVLARLRAAQGELAEAQRTYRQAAEQAYASGDDEGAVQALIGAGNVLALQGRWSEARTQYEAALAATPGGSQRARAQLLINLAMIAREEGHIDPALHWLEEARALSGHWTAADRSGWCNIAGLTALSRGALDTAREHFELALQHAGTAFDRAMILDNLSEEAIRRGALDQADAFAREAEQLALAGHARRALAEIYLRLGKIARLRSDANGVTFFEKALELCREHPFGTLEATACCEYAAFRAALGDLDEAAAWLERARDLFEQAGDFNAARDAVAALRTLSPSLP